MTNFLESLISEWYEYQGYFLRRNIKVGKRSAGGYEGELDVVAFHPSRAHLVHIESSMDALSWAKREERFRMKFEIGQKYIPNLLVGLNIPATIECIAVIGMGKTETRTAIGGGRLVMIGSMMADIRACLKTKPIPTDAVPEQFPMLRSLQFAAHHWR